MGSQSTFGWSLLTSGIVTLALVVLPDDSLWWGIGFVVLGAAALLGRG
jgi:hypothetical protein